MTLWLFVGFFAFVMAATSAAGYFYLKARSGGDAALLQGNSMPLSQSMYDVLLGLGRNVVGGGKSEEALRKQLFRAGYRTPPAYLIFHGLQVASAIGFLALVVMLVAIFKGSLADAVVPAFCAAGFGFLMPARILDYQMRARAFRIKRAVAPALDLLVLALEAGQTIDQAMKDAARSLNDIHPDLCSEFVFCHLEMSAGTSRIDALRRLGERGGDEELRRLSNLLIDGERFGSSLGPTLRTHAMYLRTRMRQEAQQTARKLGVKLIFPVFFLIFPSVLLVTLGPAYLQMRGFLDSFLK
jgi:tight adherence protein C